MTCFLIGVSYVYADVSPGALSGAASKKRLLQNLQGFDMLVGIQHPFDQVHQQALITPVSSVLHQPLKIM